MDVEFGPSTGVVANLLWLLTSMWPCDVDQKKKKKKEEK